jgi:hypothetical protein
VTILNPKRFLQIWDITCSSATLAAFLEEQGWECMVIARKAFDRHNCGAEFTNYNLVEGRALNFYREVLRAIRQFKPSVILIRYIFNILPLVRLFAPHTPLIMQFHGGDLRRFIDGVLVERKKLPWQARLATKVIVSTRDLEKWGEYYGTPIHPMFKPGPPDKRKAGTALHIKTGAAIGTEERAMQFAEANGLELTIIDRTKGEKVAHVEMPQLLQQYEWYIDIKNLTSSKVLSKTAIEFLHTSSADLPCKVYTDSGEVVTSFKTTTNEEYLALLNGLIR